MKRLRLMEEKKQKSEAFVDFFKESSVTPEVINPILEEKDSAIVNKATSFLNHFLGQI